MASSAQSGEIRGVFAKALDAKGITRRRRGNKTRRRSTAATGNVVNLQMPCAIARCGGEICQCRLTMYVMATVLIGCSIAASCILGSLYMLRELIW